MKRIAVALSIATLSYAWAGIFTDGLLGAGSGKSVFNDVRVTDDLFVNDDIVVAGSVTIRGNDAWLQVGDDIQDTWIAATGIRIFDSDARTTLVIGQSNTAYLNLRWSYNATPSYAYALL